MGIEVLGRVFGGGMTETKTGRYPGVGLGRPCQCGV